MDKENFLQALKTELKIIKYSDYTIRNYMAINANLIDFCKKAQSVESINQQDVKLFLAEKLADKTATQSILALSAIRFAFTNVFHADPTAGIKRPKKEKTLPEVLSVAEVKKLFEAADTKKSRLILKTLYSTGMRVSELTNLKKKDIYFDENEGRIKRAKGKKERIFNISDDIKEELKELIAKNPDSEYVFSGPKGKLSDRNIQKIVKKAAIKAGIQKDVHTHTLRHSFATHLLNEGVDIRKIQTLLGHEKLATTEIYTHISNEDLKKINPLDSMAKDKSWKSKRLTEFSEVKGIIPSLGSEEKEKLKSAEAEK